MADEKNSGPIFMADENNSNDGNNSDDDDDDFVYE